MNGKWRLVVQGAITIALLWYLLAGLDWASLGAVLRRLPAWFYVVSLAAVAAGQVLYAWRWRVILAGVGVRIPFARVLEQYLVGVFANNFLPSTIGGDAVKVYYLGRHHGYPAVTASILLDRVLGVGLLAVVGAVAIWATPSTGAVFEIAGLALVGVSLLAAAVLVVAVSGAGLVGRLPALGGWRVRLVEAFERTGRDGAAALRHPLVLVQAFGVVIVYAVTTALVYQRFVRVQLGADPGLVPLMAAIAATAVLVNVPIALNGLGLREQLHVALLAPLGVPAEAAVAISLVLFAHLLVISAVGGLLWLRQPVFAPAADVVSSAG